MTGAARGRFITLEGGEGAGKSTQGRLLAERLRALDLAVVQTREPGGAPGAEEIRKLLVNGPPERWTPMTELLLMAAARADHLERTIRPALKDNAWVICDRFMDSTTAYQGYGHGLDLDQVAQANRLAVGDTVPDLTVIFDLPAEAGLARAERRAGGEDRFERMNKSFHDRLRHGFLTIARAEPGRCVVIDAAQDPDSVARSVWDAVRTRLLETSDGPPQQTR